MSDLEHVLSSLNPVMVIVTVTDGSDVAGCLVGFHCQSSIHPPRHTVQLSVENHTERIARGATHLAVHLLDATDHQLAATFGGRTDDKTSTSKLDAVRWSRGPDGQTPILEGLAWWFGPIVDRHDHGGDHVAYTIELTDAGGVTTDTPLRLGDVEDIRPGHPA
jgi:flavin reductase (DIM6/NTAB) family NADH-FMN oxidoreductase RutF